MITLVSTIQVLQEVISLEINTFIFDTCVLVLTARLKVIVQTGSKWYILCSIVLNACRVYTLQVREPLTWWPSHSIALSHIPWVMKAVTWFQIIVNWGARGTNISSIICKTDMVGASPIWEIYWDGPPLPVLGVRNSQWQLLGAMEGAPLRSDGRREGSVLGWLDGISVIVDDESSLALEDRLGFGVGDVVGAEMGSYKVLVWKELWWVIQRVRAC